MSTPESSMAFFASALSSASVRAHLGAALGFNRVPKIKELSEVEADSREKWSDLIEYVAEAAKSAQVYLRSIPKQLEIDFQKNGAGKRKGRGRGAAHDVPEHALPEGVVATVASTEKSKPAKSKRKPKKRPKWMIPRQA